MKKSLLEDKTLLITGGTGSFGNAMLNAVLSQKFREVRIFSRDELKQEQMRVKLKDPRVKFHIGDVRSFDSIEAAMRGVDYVFHAAALKQVPSCEFFPIQATLTNVTGSQNVIEAAIRHHVKRVVCLSTDKAVYPINTMGITKALMEKVAQAATRGLSSSDTTICSVRYGNVMYSRGSVIPLFVEQIQTGKSFTVTEPSMTRFMLPLAMAIDLVLFALERGEQGDIFIRKAPACTVRDLVTAMKNIFYSQATIVRIGMRHGEKIFETLATREELRRSEDMGEYYRVHMDDRDLNYGKYFTEGDMREVETDDYTSHNTQQLSVPEVEELLLALPEIRADLKRAGANRG